MLKTLSKPLILLLLVNIFSHLFFLTSPAVDTETSYFYAADAIRMNGFNIYTPTYEEKPPLMFIPVSLLLSISHSIMWGRVTMLGFSLIALLYTYNLALYLSSKNAALTATFITMIFPMFFVQSIFYTDSIPQTAVFMMTLYYFFSSKKNKYLISASLAVLTKETMVLVPFILYITALIRDALVSKKFALMHFIRNVYLFLPLLAFVVWMIGNKVFFGHFVYPGNTLNILAVFSNPYYSISTLIDYSLSFFSQGNIFVICSIATLALIYSVIHKIRLSNNNYVFIFTLLLFLSTYLVFHGVAFYWNIRYVLFLYPALIVCLVVIVNSVSPKFSMMFTVLACIAFTISQFSIIHKHNQTVLGEAIDIRFIAHQQYIHNIVSSLEEYENIPIYTDYQFAHYLWNPLFNYVSTYGDHVFELKADRTYEDCPKCTCDQCIRFGDIPVNKKVLILYPEEWIGELLAHLSDNAIILKKFKPSWPDESSTTYILYEFYKPASL